MISRHVQTIFCDDVREEVTGKSSYIGVYKGVMFVNEFPVVLPKLCLVANVFTSFAEPINTLTIRVFQGTEGLLAQASVDAEVLEQAAREVRSADDESRVFNSTMLFAFSPFKVDEPTIIKVRAIVDEKEIVGIGLKIDLAPSS